MAEKPQADATGAAVRAEIDRSCAVPCIVFFASALFWLMAGTLFALLASIKFHSPGFLADWSWLTFGRVRPAHLNTVAYGWASMAGIGVMLWLMCRLCSVPLRYPSFLVVAAGIWNVGVFVGTVAILAGHSEGIEWLEFPTYAAFILFLAFAIIAVWAVATFAMRRQEHVYVSQWYLFGALFWFPWLYATVQILLLLMPVKGVPQAAINWWFGHNVLGLWFTPIGLATAYYLIPKVIGRPIYSYYMSILGFWTLALFYNWAGAHHLIAGPIPAWLVTVSIVGSMMMLIPVATVAMNHHMTMRGSFRILRYSPTLRFVVMGSMIYTAVSVQGAFMALRALNEPFHFTHHTIAHAHLGLYAFFSVIMFGAMYYIIPRLTGREWASAGLIRTHFWTVAVGFGLMFVVLTVGGIIQGFEMNQASEPYGKLVGEHGLVGGTGKFFDGFKSRNGAVPFIDIVKGTRPWLIARTVSGILILIGHAAFFFLVVRNVHAWGRQRFGKPTLFRDDQADYEKIIGVG
ncbi:MAG: cbb3-type cytochrome c oxidase subunit I [Planctomycetota bacterium]|jgi:cytochrome c oxidase cbb3-type subunit 1